MPFLSNISRTSSASGEVSPNIRAANDLERHRTGWAKVENMVVLVEAILTRRPGTRFVLECKNEAEASVMWPFRYTGSDYYTLCFNGGKMRVLKDGGFLQSAGSPYEVTVPWLAADLANLRTGASGNVLIQVCAGKVPQKITRNNHTDWTVEQYRPLNGPIGAQNLDTTKTILASAITGNISLIGTGNPFSVGQVDGIFRLNEASQSIVSLWQADETISLVTESVSGVSSNFGTAVTPDNAFDGVAGTSADTAAVTEAYVGRSLSAASPILSARVTMSSPAPGAGGTITLKLYGKKTSGVPADATDGDLLATTAYDVDLDGANAHTLTSSDATTGYLEQFVVATYSGAATTIGFSEVVLSRLATSQPAVLRRWQENIYQALTSGNTGANAPTHTEGDVSAGTGNVTWRYLNSGYGFVQITAVADANHASGTVLSRLPDSLSGTATYRWYPPEWCADTGYPKQVSAHEERMLFQRDNSYWLTKPLTVDDFEITAADDSAIARRLISPDGNYVQTEWALSSGVLVQGTRDHEWLTRAPGNFDALTVSTVRDVPDTSEGSAPHIPALVDRGCLFIGRSRKRLHYISFDRLTEKLDVQEITKACRHIFEVGAVKLAWQRDPDRICWIMLADGTLASLTFDLSEKLIAATRHPMTNCFLEDLIAIPTSDDGRSDIYLQTRRTINGATRRYYEQLQPFFEAIDPDNPTAEGAWFVDCALRYQGAATNRITNLDHLAGQTVRVLANGAQIDNVQVDAAPAADGKIGVTLTEEVTDAIVGLPIAWKLRDLPRSIMMNGSSSQGNLVRASHIGLEVKESAGGTVKFNDGAAEDITETGDLDYGAAIPLTTGLLPVNLMSPSETEGVIELNGDNALPFTLLGANVLLQIEGPN